MYINTFTVIIYLTFTVCLMVKSDFFTKQMQFVAKLHCILNGSIGVIDSDYVGFALKIKSLKI